MKNNIYSILPVFVQNLIMTLVNNYKYYQKYGAIPALKPLSKIYKNLEVSNFNDENTVPRINKLLRYATTHVPYYRRNKHLYNQIETLEDLKKIPILKKSVLKEFNSDFISEQRTKFNSYNFRTSGSTGTPITGAIKSSELKFRLTMFLVSLKRAGIDYSRPLARFPGADIARKGSVYRIDHINNHLLFSIYHLSNGRIKDYHHALTAYKIEIIEGYPSTIISLVHLLKANNLKLPSIRHVLTTAEKLMDHQKEEIEDFFSCQVFDFYGSSEGSVLMYLTEDNYYLNSNKIGYFECVDEDYNEVNIGDSGRMLVTSFTSSFMPLIRYDIGDYATLISNNNGLIKVKEILGRQEDIYITPDGKSFGRFSLVLKYLPPEVLESQLILQQKNVNVILQYVSDDELNPSLFKKFENKMNDLLEMEFIFSYQRKIKFDKSKRGKLRAVTITE